jgi:hypothetical protein
MNFSLKIFLEKLKKNSEYQQSSKLFLSQKYLHEEKPIILQREQIGGKLFVLKI